MSEPRRTAEEMLSDIEKLDSSVALKLDREDVPAEVRRRFEEDLRPRLEECRAIVGRNGSRARNVCMDALAAYRELAFTALNHVVTPNF